MEFILTKRASLRDQVADFLVNSLTPFYLFLRRNRPAWVISQDQLESMPNGSLGRELYYFLKDHNLKLIPRAEFHDVYHVLFDLPTTNMFEETCIQFVMVGNGKYSLPNVIPITITLLFYPEHWGAYYKAFLKGRNAKRFVHMDWEMHLMDDLKELQQQIFDQ